MWCPNCQGDVVAIASADNQRATCSACGTELVVAASSAQEGPVTRDPRELLERWAKEDAASPLGSLSYPAPRYGSGPSASGAPRRSVKPAGHQLRFDGQHPIGREAPRPATVEQQPIAADAPPAPPNAPGPILSAAGEPSRDLVIHPPHGLAGNPHFEAAPLLARKKKTPTRWITLAGQLAAYLGVGTLTVGASMVLMAYFGGPENYAPTGWLVTTAGQMLLFLGVVTLVSGGMEQTSQEVAERIDSLGAHILRLEEYRARKSGKDSSTDAA